MAVYVNKTDTPATGIIYDLYANDLKFTYRKISIEITRRSLDILSHKS